MKEKTTKSRITKEKRRLTKIFANIEDGKKQVVNGLIERAAFMRVQLEDLEEELIEEGWTEDFKQTDKVAPYKRQRPAGQTYISLNSNYQKIIKQLTDIVPEDQNKDAAQELLNFINAK